MYSATRALTELEAQHDLLRGMMDRCEDLADELDAGRSGPMQLTREVARLRLAFDAHNKFEEQLLRPVLLDQMSATRLEHVIDSHVADHGLLRKRLASTETSALRGVIDAMRAHLEAEERYLFAARAIAARAVD
jgi:hypothetical protein